MPSLCSVVHFCIVFGSTKDLTQSSILVQITPSHPSMSLLLAAPLAKEFFAEESFEERDCCPILVDHISTQTMNGFFIKEYEVPSEGCFHPFREIGTMIDMIIIWTNTVGRI